MKEINGLQIEMIIRVIIGNKNKIIMDELSQRYFGIITKMIKENKTTKELENELKKTEIENKL